MRTLVIATAMCTLLSAHAVLAGTALDQAMSKSKKYIGGGFENYKGSFCVCLDGNGERHEKLGIVITQGVQFIGGANRITVRCDVLKFDPDGSEQGTDHCFGPWITLAK